MSILLTGDEGLYTRLGRIGRVLLSLAEFRAEGLGTDVANFAAEYDGFRDPMAGVIAQQRAAKSAAGGLVPSLVSAAQATLLQMVRDDQPARTWTLSEAVAEVVRQTAAEGETVPACATSASHSALSPFAGDGLLVYSIRGRDGVPLENLFQEILWLTCTADAQLRDTTRGQERFRFRGGVAEPDPWSDLWPAGSGGTIEFLCADPASDAIAGGNQLVNSSFDAFTSNTPDNWVVEVGTPGTHIVGPAAVSAYDEVGCLSLPGSATLAAISQTFGDDDGTPALVGPLFRYALALRVKVSAVPATGTLILELTDDANAVITDPQGANLRLTIDLTAATTSYVAYTTVWVTPRALPTTVKFRLRVGTAIESGKTAFVDHLAFVPLRAPYAGGPAAAVISGVTPFAVGDGWTLAALNDRASASYGATWQALMDRLFGMRDLGLQLASSPSAPTLEDTLITSQ